METLNPVVLDILYRRISSGGLNPSTGKPMQVEDIKIEAYKLEVQRLLTLQ